MPGAEGSAPEAGARSTGLDLPWLQAVTDRAAKPSTERLTDAPHSPQPSPPAQAKPSSPEPKRPAEAAPPGAPKQEAGEEAVAAAPPTQPIEEPGDPNERPPEWVASILEPQEERQEGPQQSYEPEELAHIMPWVHGERSGEAINPEIEAVGGLPPWLGDVTVQETLQSTRGAEGVDDPAVFGLDDIQPFIPPAEEASAPVAPREAEVAPEWLASITGPPEREPQAPAMRRADLSQINVSAPLVQPRDPGVPMRSPREGSIETLAALLAPTTPEVAQWAVPGMERALNTGVEISARRGRLGRIFPDGVIYMLVLAALLAVLIARPPFRDVPAPRAEGAQAFYDAVENVGGSGIVLVVYDWDATRSAEMSLLAESVTRHLMSRRLRFVTISTVPQGPGFAEMVTRRVSEDYPGYEYGRDYLVLGYLSGGSTGLAALTSDYRTSLPRDYRQGRFVFTNYPIFGNDQLEGLSSFRLIVTLTSDEGELRSWIEQVGTRVDVAMVAAVPQGLEPSARPYLNIPRSGLDAVLSGPSGALQYANLMRGRGLDPGSATSVDTPTLTDRLNAGSVAAILVAGVIIAALLSMLIGRARV
jgi:hypothetical protein